LHQALAMADRAKQLQPDNSDYVTEYATIQEMLGNVTSLLINYFSLNFYLFILL
jgi:hypothetical protein